MMAVIVILILLIQSMGLTSAGDFVPADREVITGRNCDPVAISERGDDAAGRRRRILGATTTRGFLQPFREIHISAPNAEGP